MEKDARTLNPDSDDTKYPSGYPVAKQSIDRFVNPGIMLFIDQLLVAAGGWLYWIMISKFVLTSEIGHATTVYSLVLLANTILQLGLEYPLLKKSISQRQQLFGTVLLIELVFTAISIPIVLFSIGNLYAESAQFSLIAIGMLALSSVGFVSRFALLGLSNSRTILVVDAIGIVLKFGSAFALVSTGYGTLGILISFLIQAGMVTVTTVLVATKAFGLRIGNLSFIKTTLKDGLINTPTKLSSTLIISLSVVLLASFGIGSSELGVFYIATMLSIVVGSFASSLAFMSIPASSALNKDLSTGSLRIGLAFTAPIVATLIAAPEYILSIIGTQYTSAGEILVILSAGILPSAILVNATSRFNNQNMPGKLLAIGTIRVGVFLVSFFALVPVMDSLGAAYSILISFSSSAALSIIWSGKAVLKYIGISSLSVISGVVISKSVAFIVDGVHPVLVIGTAVGAALCIMLALRCTSTKEIAAMIASVRKV
ncbi:MAG: O-antigen/teichoic acid export membrane protein [Candidatus Nitrosomirales archaeon]|jgi:O-antigen/teichoic acid export membrane protein